MIRMDIESIVVGNGPMSSLVILRPRHSSLKDGQTQLPICIGTAEAGAIGMSLESVPHNRPLTHELFKTALKTLGAKITSVSIYKVEGTTFFASLHLLTPQNERKALDCRPSDAIALALQAHAPIFVDSDVLVTASFPDFKAVKKDEQSRELKKFHTFINSVSPEDF